MKYLDLNVASKPRLNYLRYWGLTVLLLAAAGILTWNGFVALGGEDGLTLEEKTEMLSLRRADRGYADSLEKFAAETRRLKSRWEGRVRFANALISRKANSFIGGLNLLEKALPETVYLNRLTLDQDRPNRLEMEVLVPAYTELINAYRRLSSYQLEITSEIPDRTGRYRVSLSLRIGK